MNQFTAHAFAPTPAQPMTRRALAKQHTRRKLLDAARRLFNERGYEAATVREIAAAAGLSTGAVFASFADKADLFGEVILDDHGALEEHLKAADDKGPATEAALLKLFATAYAFPPATTCHGCEQPSASRVSSSPRTSGASALASGGFWRGSRRCCAAASNVASSLATSTSG